MLIIMMAVMLHEVGSDDDGATITIVMITTDDVPVKIKVMAGNASVTSKDNLGKEDLGGEVLGSMMKSLT